MRNDWFRRAATLALMLATVGAATPTSTHTHAFAAPGAAIDGHANHDGLVDHGHDHGGPVGHDETAHRHAAVLGLFEVQIPAPADRTDGNDDGEPFSLIEEAPLIAAAACPVPDRGVLTVGALPEPPGPWQPRRDEELPSTASGGNPGGVVLRL